MMWEKNLGLKINLVTMDYAAFIPEIGCQKVEKSNVVKPNSVQAFTEPANGYAIVGYKLAQLCTLFETDYR